MTEQNRSNSKVNNEYRSDSGRYRSTGTYSSGNRGSYDGNQDTGRSRTQSISSRTQSSSSRAQSANSRSQSSGNRAQSANSRTQSSGNRAQSSGSRVQNSGNRTSGSGSRNNGGLSRRKQQQLKARRRRRFILVLIGILAIAVAVTVIIYISRKKAVESFVQDECIATGVTIDNVDVSSLTIEEASAKWEAEMEKLGGVAFTFRTSESSTDILLSELGFGVSDKTTEELVNEAYSVVRDGSVWKRYKQIKQLEKTGYNVEVNYTYDRETAAAVIGERCQVMNGAAQNAEIVFAGVDDWSIKESINGIVVRVDDTTALLDEIFASWDHASHAVDVVLTEDEPEITTDDLQAISDVLSSYGTVYGSGNAGRIQNVETGTAHINGTYLLPGEEVSVDSLMGPYTVENGYAEAASYEDGEVVQTMGGGICQVSSTLYNALLFAELEITERYEHSMLVSYVQPGRDAAIADDVKDLKFCNNTENPIYVSGWCDGYSCYFYIFGKETRDSSRVITFRSDLITETEYKTEYEDDPELEEGKEKVKTHGYNGGTYKLYKEIYENGTKVNEEYMTTSVYMPFNEVVQKGTKKVEKTEEETEGSEDSEESDGSESDQTE